METGTKGRRRIDFKCAIQYFFSHTSFVDFHFSTGAGMHSVSKATYGISLTAGQGIASQTLWILMFATLTAAGAQVEIPHYPVPYTLQTLIVLLAGAFLGARNGALSMMVYLAAGAIGLPVFSGFGAGLARLLGPTGGYLLAFPVAAALVGYMIPMGTSLGWRVLSMVVGLVVIFTSGTIQLYNVMFHDWKQAFNAGFLIFSWWDIVKLMAAATAYHELAKRWPRLPR